MEVGLLMHGSEDGMKSHLKIEIIIQVQKPKEKNERMFALAMGNETDGDVLSIVRLCRFAVGEGVVSGAWRQIGLNFRN